MKQQGFFLNDSAFEYREIPITYVSSIPNANANDFLEVAERMGAGSEELWTPEGKATFTLWIFTPIITTDKNSSTGFGVDFPKISDNQEYIIRQRNN